MGERRKTEGRYKSSCNAADRLFNASTLGLLWQGLGFSKNKEARKSHILVALASSPTAASSSLFLTCFWLQNPFSCVLVW
jgi:hypothetical protein